MNNGLFFWHDFNHLYRETITFQFFGSTSRRERGVCRLCFSTQANTDFQLSGNQAVGGKNATIYILSLYSQVYSFLPTYNISETNNVCYVKEMDSCPHNVVDTALV